jgi:mannose-6-phosphate isomerase-like protein (cupin superfamily)
VLVKKSRAKLKVRKPMKIHEYNLGTKRFSCAMIAIDGDHGKIKALKSDRIYFILSGKGVFEIAGKKYSVSKGDLLLVPKKTPYNIIGKMRYFLVNSPAFDPKDDVLLE